MSVNSLALSPARPAAFPRVVRRLAIAVLAIAFVAVIATLAASLVGLSAAPTIAPKSPFGTGLREAAPAATGIGGRILALQSAFSRALTAALAAAKADGGAWPALIGLGFVYGVFHAAGPGHGKGVISGYLLASKRTLVRGLGLSLTAALLQAGVAIALVGLLVVVLNATATTVSLTADRVELASFVVLMLVGAALLWRKTAALVPASTRADVPVATGHGHAHGAHDLGHGHHAHDHGGAHVHVHDDACGCGHTHGPSAAEVEKLRTWRDSAGVVLAAGIRPCSGAIIVLVFAHSQGIFATGVAAVLAMGLGTAITTGGLAALAVLAKGVATRLAAGRGRAGAVAVVGLETLAAALVVVLGGALLIGSFAAHGAS